MRWISLLSSVFFFGISTLCLGQQIDLGEGDIDFQRIPFKAEFMRKNGIVEIEVETLEKKSNRPIRSSGHSVNYHFNERGHCAHRTTFRSLRGRQDSVLESFGLDPQTSGFETYLRKDQRGLYREEYEVRDEITTIHKYRGSEDAPKDLSHVDIEYIVKSKKENTDTYTTLNSDSLPYKRVHFVYSDLGYLISKKEEFLVSRDQTETNFSYNSKGKLAFRTTEKEGTETMWSYEYDETGSLWKLFKREAGKLVWRKEILYNKKGYIDAIITKQESTEDIRIERFYYTEQDDEQQP